MKQARLLECDGYPRSMARRAVYVVGCGAAKLDREAPARELYTGSLFVAARRHVEALVAQWFVLSAKYGVVRPEWELEPYERKLSTRGADLNAWVQAAASGALSMSFWLDRDHEAPAPAGPRRFVFLCGAEYADPVALRLESWGYPTEQPLAGLQLGERLRWFKEQREVAA